MPIWNTGTDRGQEEIFGLIVVTFFLGLIVLAVWLGTHGGDPSIVADIANTLTVPVIIIAFIVALFLGIFS